MMKTKIGILFGGLSKEREISFAGGRTVYDNLNKRLFDAVPIFIDSFFNFILLDWEYIYKGSIRDFYPAPDQIPHSPGEFQIYAESLGNLNPEEQSKFIKPIGKLIPVHELHNYIDMAFLCLHGPYGEDGRIQGLLEYFGIPYTGSGILPSAIGINKIVQKRLMINAGFNTPSFITLHRAEWLFMNDFSSLRNEIKNKVGFPCVVKAPTQGSSIGVNVVQENDLTNLKNAIDKAFFIRHIQGVDWLGMSPVLRNEWVRITCDIREGIGIPVRIVDDIIFHPDKLLEWLDAKSAESPEELFRLESLDCESEIIIESFIEGREFSSIVIDTPEGGVVCLPPTEIKKGKEVFDYRSKYLPGLSRKITPIDLPEQSIELIRKSCVDLYKALCFSVYARIDGFITSEGKIFLNDPNTTSGMMPSSFFFHQAAEIGLNPSQFITYIIYSSLEKRKYEFKNNGIAEKLLQQLEEAINSSKVLSGNQKKIAVIFGGYSSERHISVESGRNVYEKLSSSTVYQPIPVFLSGNNEDYELNTIPLNLMLKDNADDIREKIQHYRLHPLVKKIIEECREITDKFGDSRNLQAPEKISFQSLADRVDEIFIALHGRPGEDGALQRKLSMVGLPFNGSDADSSAITIDKYRTNELLKAHGLMVAEHLLVTEDAWFSDKEAILEKIVTLGFPFIAKPVDDGCSSAVKKIKSMDELYAFAKLIFRKDENPDPLAAQTLGVKPKEEFPSKNYFLVEELIDANGADNFLEITGGLLTHLRSDGNIEYEIFEASEALSEGEVLSLEEKFLAGQGQNITPARYSIDKGKRQEISDRVKKQLEKAARVLNVTGYARIDAFVRVWNDEKVEVIFIEVNSLPGMTPATCIFHQSALNGYKPYDFIEKIMNFAESVAELNRKSA